MSKLVVDTHLSLLESLSLVLASCVSHKRSVLALDC